MPTTEAKKEKNSVICGVISKILKEMTTNPELNNLVTSITKNMLEDKAFAEMSEPAKYAHLIVTGMAINEIIDTMFEQEEAKEFAINQLGEQEFDCYEAEADDGSFCYLMAQKGFDISKEMIEEHVSHSGKKWTGKYRKLSDEETKEQVELVRSTLQEKE